MILNRRAFLKTTAAGLAAGTLVSPSIFAEEKKGWKISSCDWSLGKKHHPGVFDVAKEIGLEGVQVSFPADCKPEYNLYDPKTQELYLQRSEETGVAISSFALGGGNAHPFWLEDDGEQLVRDAALAMDKMNVGRVILIPFFGRAQIKSDAIYEEVIRRFRNVAPVAADAGVILAIESTLSAEGHLRIIEAVKSSALQVYYDPGNMKDYQKMDTDAVCADIRKLDGWIAEAHAKDGNNLLGEGPLDYTRILATYREVGYTTWQVLEGSVKKDFGLVKSYRQNAAFLRQH
ncbi:MAG: sugar phosphate isomerase/epimerase family protein [Planctomycetia bacterium]|nr:sugar phosphate isomerase/epimerase family protein [Planctomycetia bacterium]